MFERSRARDQWVGVRPQEGRKTLLVRVEDRALDRHDKDRVDELDAFLRGRDYFVKRVKGGLEVVPYNPLSERGDRERLARALESWQRLHPVTHVEIVDERSKR